MLKEAGKSFQEQLLDRVPFVATMTQALQQKQSGGVKKDFFIDILDEHFSQSEAELQFETLLTWADMHTGFDYDADGERLHLATAPRGGAAGDASSLPEARSGAR